MIKKIIAAGLAAVMAAGLVSCGSKSGESLSISDTGTVVWKTKYATVTYESCTGLDQLSPVIEFTVENKSDKTLYLSPNGVYINDYCYTGKLDQEVPVGETATAQLKMSSGDAERLGIGEVCQISFELMMNNPDKSGFDNVYLNSGMITLDTGKTGWREKQTPPEGELIYEGDGVKIIAAPLSDYAKPRELLPVYVENSTDKEIGISLASMRVNGRETEMSSGTGLILKPGKKAFELLPVYDAFMNQESSNITDAAVHFVLLDLDGTVIKDIGYVNVKGIS